MVPEGIIPIVLEHVVKKFAEKQFIPIKRAGMATYCEWGRGDCGEQEQGA
jgi:hypothetical protein